MSPCCVAKRRSQNGEVVDSLADHCRMHEDEDRSYDAPAVYHCGSSVLDAVLSCLTKLTLSDHPWKYFQYLSGVDLPLRTNKEMVQIFKRLNGSINAEVVKMVEESFLDKLLRWIWPKDEMEPIYGMKLIKSSLSATFSRETAHFFVGSEQAKALRSFIRRKWRLICPDEYFWLTLAGNPKRKYVRYSCVFGVRDIPNLLQRAELIAHKLYITYQPAAFFCLYRHVKRRAFSNDEPFDDEPYGNLPGPRIMREQSVDEWANAI
uniref:Uncharacterized protein n=1 Tax=Parascaris univalens TaxID=6257 RepID=A0A915AEC5_PARUN